MDKNKGVINSIRLPIFLCLLIMFLVFYPYLHQKFPEQIAILESFFTLIMISGISLLINRKSLLIFMLSLAACILIGILVAGIYETMLSLFIVLLIEFIFFSIIFINLLNYIFQHQEVTLSSLYAAITSYLILGILFAIFYTIAAIISPDIFHYASSLKPILKIYPHPAFFSEALYFSFVTLATLGYGDLVPVFGPIKMIASLEAIIGQLYIAILIARLVSSQRKL